MNFMKILTELLLGSILNAYTKYQCCIWQCISGVNYNDFECCKRMKYKRNLVLKSVIREVRQDSMLKKKKREIPVQPNSSTNSTQCYGKNINLLQNKILQAEYCLLHAGDYQCNFSGGKGGNFFDIGQIFFSGWCRGIIACSTLSHMKLCGIRHRGLRRWCWGNGCSKFF